jgi:adenylate cyclase
MSGVLGWRQILKQRRQTTYWLCLVWAVAICLAQQFRFHPLLKMELATLDYRFALRGARPAPTNIVILAIDQDSCSLPDRFDPLPPELARLRQFKYPRGVYAEAIARLCDAGARAVSLDLVFFTASEAAEDEALQQTVAKYRDRVVLGSNFSDTGRQLLTPEVVVPEAVPMEEVSGYVNFWPDVGGVVRRSIFRLYPSWVAGAARGGRERAEISFDALTARKAMPAARVTEPGEAPLIQFPGAAGTFRTIPFYQLFYDKTWKGLLESGAWFKDKIVLIGPAGNFHHDQHPTSFGLMDGVEIHAAALSTLLQQNAPRELPAAAGWLATLALAAATAAFLNWGSHPFLKLGWCVGLGAAYCGAAQVAFALGGWVAWVATPLGALAGCGMGGLGVQVLAEQFEKHRVKQTLERYVSKQVAAEILKDTVGFQQSLGGERRAVTILFSDIRGFTSISEKMNPVELVAELNEYLTAMVDEVLRYDGTLDKFIGDAVMAVYGAPTSAGAADDAWRAVQTAHGMRVRLAQLQAQWRAQGKPELRIGIGLNHGEVVVGNIGSPQRMEYTVIGDPVNVASRVEGLNKELHTDILMTEPVYELVRDRVESEPAGEMAVKGRAQMVRVYNLKSLKG